MNEDKTYKIFNGDSSQRRGPDNRNILQTRQRQ